jgi:hypothetical protein
MRAILKSCLWVLVLAVMIAGCATGFAEVPGTSPRSGGQDDAALRLGPAPRKVRQVRTQPVVLRDEQAPDSLIVDGSWTNPVDDGRGALDSMQVLTEGMPTESALVAKTIYRSEPWPSSHQTRAAVATVSGSATWEVRMCVGSWRRGLYVSACSNRVSVVVDDVPPQAVSGLLITVLRVPPQ